MSSRRYPTDAGLSFRVALSLLGLAVVYAPLFFWLAGLFWALLVLRVPAMALLVAGVAVLAARALEASTLRADDIRLAERAEAPELVETLERICGLTGVAVPAVQLWSPADPKP